MNPVCDVKMVGVCSKLESCSFSQNFAVRFGLIVLSILRLIFQQKSCEFYELVLFLGKPRSSLNGAKVTDLNLILYHFPSS